MSILASCLSRVIILLSAAAISVSFSASTWGEEGKGGDAISVSFSASTWGEEGVKYGRIGGNITLMCNNKNDSSVAEWRFNGSPDIPRGVFNSIGHLQLSNTDLFSMGNYSCYSRSGELLSSVHLRLGYPPGMPTVSCRASDFENFSCYWKSSVETLLPTRFIASYRNTNNHNSGICVQEPFRPNMCSVRMSEIWSSYQMNITEENPLGSSFRLLVVTLQSIVKPDPPEKLVVEPVPFSPKRLRVTWAYPSSWPQEPHFLLKFRLQYRPVVHSYWSVVETVNLSDIITDAFAGTEHVVQVSARDYLDAGNWSEWSAEVRATPWTSPKLEAGHETTTTDAEYPPFGPSAETSDETTRSEADSQVEEPFDRSDPLEKVAILISLGVFAFVVLALLLIIGALIWIRMGRRGKESGIKTRFLSAIHMKALPKAQIL
ncbi:interleukin-11 receptor subunit alpha [Rhinophrynus dorsalis]